MAQEKVANLLHTFTVSAIISIVATGLLLTEPTQHANADLDVRPLFIRALTLRRSAFKPWKRHGSPSEILKDLGI